ncbi:glycosyltransferase family 4 protein [Formicincola oecophyllae]|uniref:Glycosyltransferase family 4 protein n=1 Tax=Formicincola oecophyllae TaxID=2558361 RepID=A0A4Y6UAN1_9PROT|nr:glycosyltransferase family 4 protein [Formicincola oecophyllae]QDH14204.1 glycosyltransferase family 4 protein [Formicincola oecophyllae]
MRVGVIVQGLFEKSDSIGYDAVLQHKLLRQAHDCTLYAETSNPALHPDVTIKGMDDFHRDFSGLDLVIYHFCDGWAEMDAFVLKRPEKFIVRWHNNTPPWFYVFKQKRFAQRSLQGFEVIADFAAAQVRLLTNSRFTSEQFAVLGGDRNRAEVVYPGSRYLFSPPEKFQNAGDRRGDVINVLFVGRFVAHKGHRNLIHVCDFIARHSPYHVNLHIVGRRDTALDEYNSEIEALSAASAAEVHVYGEVSEAKLYELYDTADVFLFLSEHEGFGLPVFEAMSRNLPLVAWRTSALDDLLESHPLAFKAFDIAHFAAAVLALKKPEVRARTLAIQQGFGALYALDVVKRQLLGAVGTLANDQQGPGALPAATAPQAEATPPAEGANHAFVRNALEEERARLPAVKGANAFLHDFSGHYVSKYDLKVFRTFFDEQQRNDINSMGNLAQGRVNAIDLAPEAFSLHHGEKKPDHLLIPAGAPHRKHIFFGPYADIKQGHYELDLVFAAQEGGSYPRIRVELASRTHGVFAVFTRRLPHTRGMAFHIPADDSDFEIRATSLDPIREDILFQKAVLRRAAPRDAVTVSAEAFTAPGAIHLKGALEFPAKAHAKGTVLLSGASGPLGKGPHILDMVFRNIGYQRPCPVVLQVRAHNPGGGEGPLLQKMEGDITQLRKVPLDVPRPGTRVVMEVAMLGAFEGDMVFEGAQITSNPPATNPKAKGLRKLTRLFRKK